MSGGQSARSSVSCALLFLAGASCATQSAVSAQAANPGCVWNPATDFRLAPGNANPNPDACGDATSWGYEHAAALHSPSTYLAMTGYDTAVYGVHGIERWYDAATTSSLHVPMVGANDSGAAETSGTFSWPSGSMMMHPVAGDSAVLSWRSPITGAVSVSGGFQLIDGGGGSGITWYIDMGPATLASGSIPASGNQAFSQTRSPNVLASIPVTPATVLYFIVTCAPNGNCDFDSTKIDLTIQQIPPPPPANVPEAPITPILMAFGLAAVGAGWGLLRARGQGRH